jgi:hypothetical protein
MSGEHHGDVRIVRFLGNIRQLVNEHHTLPFEALDHRTVVYDMPSDIQGWQAL